MTGGRDRPYYSGKHKCHGVNVLVIAGPRMADLVKHGSVSSALRGEQDDRDLAGGLLRAVVVDTNERALRFYHRHGWTDTGRSQLDRGPGGTELHERRLHHALSE